MLYDGQSAWWRGRGATFPKCSARVNYHLIILSSLLWECPQLWAFQIWRCMQGQVFSHVENLTDISSASDQTKFQGRRKKPFLRQRRLQHVKYWHSIDLSSSKTNHKINSLNFNHDFSPAPTNIIVYIVEILQVFITLGKELQKGFCEYLGPTSGRAQISRTAALLVLTKYWSGIDKFEHIRLVPVLGVFFISSWYWYWVLF